MKSKNRYVALLIICIVTILSACGGENPENSNDVNGEHIIRMMSLSELTSLDPAAMLDFPDAIIQNASFEGLYFLDENDEVQPGVASDLPDISADGKTYTFTLRENAKWSNGDAVTAADFEYAWKRMIDPENGFLYNFLMHDLIENASEIATGEMDPETLGVRAIDTNLLEVKLTNPAQYFTSLMVFPIFFPQNREVVETFGSDYGTNSESIVFNGPFIVEDWQQSQMDWRLKKNPAYWNHSTIPTEEIHFQVIKETSTALNLFEDDQLDVAIVTGEIAKQMHNSETFQSYPAATMDYIRLNQQRRGQATPLANENLRKALALGIDKDNLITNIMADGSKPLDGAITEGFVRNPKSGEDFRSEAGSLMQYDPEQALSFWQRAQEELGESITLDLLTTDDSGYKKMGESLQWALEDLFDGLTVTMRSMPAEVALNTASESDYDLFLIYWTPDYQDPYSTLKMMYSGNNRHYSNPEYDRLLDEARFTYALEPEKRWQSMIAAEKELMENTAGMIVLSQNQNSVLQKLTISGLNYHTFAAPMSLRNVTNDLE
ncbi:peptide ABC transporter substrate-binding protein [Enterococcus sp. RIT-PI-f]|uniref:peptide ABC transporter substrate-binding protein n=1 Tax=Enterococcus sp. RIT-PI-f TaxID=1690244 RepID=UPI0006B8F466|nr:peptide ABC transporter substrate-binding protein [Enterococcus sp. RIT-PI-f]KPG73002.1 peptide ABC transporter substrate-binding protein [Enterococcus sp. RIT-PI-f]